MPEKLDKVFSSSKILLLELWLTPYLSNLFSFHLSVLILHVWWRNGGLISMNDTLYSVPVRETKRGRGYAKIHRDGLTAGEVWWVVRVGQKQVVWLGHPEVHHLACVLQRSHCVLVHHVLQTHVVHLVVDTSRIRRRMNEEVALPEHETESFSSKTTRRQSKTALLCSVNMWLWNQR